MSSTLKLEATIFFQSVVLSLKLYFVITHKTTVLIATVFKQLVTPASFVSQFSDFVLYFSSKSIKIYSFIYIYIYGCVCVCVCVCACLY